MLGLMLKAFVRRVLRAAGIDVFRAKNTFRVHADAVLSLVETTERLGLDVVFDIGANAGQFGERLRNSGFAGRIVSIEPLAAPHAALTARAGRDDLWTVAERTAIGDQVGECTINVSANSVSSSLLPMLDRHVASAADSVYLGTEQAPITTLDAVVGRLLPDERQQFALKIDTQGFEDRVLAGARRSLHRVGALYLEMSLVPLYEKEPTFAELFSTITRAGLHCIALSPGFSDASTGEVLQVDGLFVRFL